MTQPFQAGAVIYAKDVQCVATFYIRILNFEQRSAAEDHVVLESPAFQLVIVRMPEEIAESIEISRPPVRREDTAIKLIFPVANIAVAREQARAFGGGLNPPEHEWRFQGQTVCDGNDPEGNVIQLRETNAAALKEF